MVFTVNHSKSLFFPHNENSLLLYYLALSLTPPASSEWQTRLPVTAHFRINLAMGLANPPIPTLPLSLEISKMHVESKRPDLKFFGIPNSKNLTHP